MKYNNKGFGLTEVIVAATIFIMVYISMNGIINANNQSFFSTKNESNISSSYGEIFGFLYEYKKNYGTTLFKQKIGMVDGITCSYNIDSSSNGNDWCLSYPYYTLENGYNNIYFNSYNNDTNKANLEVDGTLNSISLLESGTQTLSTMHDFLKTNKIMNSQGKQILIFYKQRAGTEDFFDFDIRYINYYNGSYHIIFEKQFSLY